MRGIRPVQGMRNAMAERAPVTLAPEPAPSPEPSAPEPPPIAAIAAPEPRPEVGAGPEIAHEPDPEPIAALEEPELPPLAQAIPVQPPLRRGWLGKLPNALRRYLSAPVVHRLDDWRAGSDAFDRELAARLDVQFERLRLRSEHASRRMERDGDRLARRLDRLQDAVIRRTDVAQHELHRRADVLQDAALRRIDALEGSYRDLVAGLERRLDALEALAKGDLAAGRETARRLEDQDAELGRLRGELNVLREQSDLLLRIIGPRFDELEVKVRPLVEFDADSWAVRLADGYVLVPRAQPEFSVQVANAPSGGLEAGTRRVLQALIRPGMTVADVGANVGLLTLAMARATGPQGRIHAFEPEPGPRAQLEKMLRLNGLSWVDVHAVAAGAEAGRLKLHVSPIIGHSSLYELPAEEESAAKVMDVEVVTLDQSVEEPLDVVKIDVEGAELDVLAGMSRHLKKGRDIAVVAEFGPGHLARTGVAPEAWWQAFKDQGFAAYAIAEPSGLCAPAALRPLMKQASTNLVFVRRGGEAERRLPRG